MMARAASVTAIRGRVPVRRARDIVVFAGSLPLIATLIACSLTALQGCGTLRESFLVTRSRTDTFHQRNVEEERTRGLAGRDNGVIRPSERQIVTESRVTEYDSVCVHNYPNFSRIGAFEVSGLVAGGRDATRHPIGNGLFGVHNTFGLRESRDSALFNGYLFRAGIWERRFPVLGKDWSIGTSVIEGIFNGTKDGQQLLGVLPVYLRKRIYLRDSPPYVDVQPFAGASLFAPFRYVHAGASLHVALYGGANLFAQAGIAVGGRANPDASEIDALRVFPYAGLGLSMLDFWNTEADMDREWRDHRAPARRVGFLAVTMLRSSEGASDGIVFGDGTSDELAVSRTFNGFIAQFGSVAFPADGVLRNLTLGTSLVNVFWLGNFEGGAGILPFRATYQSWVFSKILLEPFIEVNLYPSQILHIGARVNAGDFLGMNLGVQAGGTYGTSGTLTSNIFPGWTQDASGVYAGVSFGVGDFYASPVIEHFKDKNDCSVK
jgi:hypothetical protein